jgi:3-oxoacyl-[acyl-carrier protein] reductase
MNRLEGRTALVTGSSRGIGAAIASLFAEEGARVAVHGRDRDALEAVRAGIADAGGTATAVAADLTSLDAVEGVREEVEARLGPVDVNLTATFLTLKSFLPGMKARGRGSIVTMSSAAARRPHPGSPIAYAAAKAGVELLTKDVAAQAGPFGVRANCLAPETILTERNREQIPGDVQERLVAEHPIRRLGTPEDVARAALFLAGDEAPWITGVVLDVAGGSVLA